LLPLLHVLLLGWGCGRRHDNDTTAGSPSHRGLRVVSLTPSLTEVVHAVGGTDLLVGVDQYSSYPPEALALPKVGDFLSPNLEAIVALHPDIVLADAVQAPAAASLKTSGIQVITFKMKTFPDVRATLISVGDALGMQAAAKRAVDTLDHDLAEVAAGAA